MTTQEQDDYFGVCPVCRKTDGHTNVGRDHWFFCKEHKTRWWAGSNMLSGWRDETEDEQRQKYNEIGLGEFEKVEPYSSYDRPRKPELASSPARTVIDLIDLLLSNRDCVDDYREVRALNRAKGILQEYMALLQAQKDREMAEWYREIAFWEEVNGCGRNYDNEGREILPNGDLIDAETSRANFLSSALANASDQTLEKMVEDYEHHQSNVYPHMIDAMRDELTRRSND